jgi:TonB family protein
MKYNSNGTLGNGILGTIFYPMTTQDSGIKSLPFVVLLHIIPMIIFLLSPLKNLTTELCNDKKPNSISVLYFKTSYIENKNTIEKHSNQANILAQGNQNQEPQMDNSANNQQQISNNPKYQFNPNPQYPEEAVSQQLEGEAIIIVKVSEQGNVIDAKLEKSSGYSILDRSALSGVKKWILNIDNSKARQFLIPVQFKLTN